MLDRSIHRPGQATDRMNDIKRGALAATIIVTIGFLGMRDFEASAGPATPHLPDIKTEQGLKDAKQGVVDGTYTEVMIRGALTDLGSLAAASLPSTANPDGLKDGLQAENGGSTLVHPGDIFVVPTTPQATALHNDEFSQS
jgi:hypothetical protein